MNIESDLKLMREFWANRSVLGKVLLCCGFACSCTSIASLGDAAFKFKGALGVAIDAYQRLTEYVSDWMYFLVKVEIPENLVGMLIASALSLSITLRFVKKSEEEKARSKMMEVWKLHKKLEQNPTPQEQIDAIVLEHGYDADKLPLDFKMRAFIYSGYRRSRRATIALLLLFCVGVVIASFFPLAALLLPAIFVAQSAITLDEFVWLRDTERLKGMAGLLAAMYLVVLVAALVSEGLYRASGAF